jgi:Lrp/AsnC family leucine-responsive transcriptional regulator
MDSITSLDKYDRELIELLQINARASYQEMANATGLSPATVRRRVERVLANRAVQLIAVPVWGQLGFNLVAFVGVTVELSQLNHVATEMSKMPEFYWVAMTTGDYDLLAEIVLPTNWAVADFVIDRIAHIEGVRSFRLLTTLRFFKTWGDYRLPPVDDDG